LVDAGFQIHHYGCVMNKCRILDLGAGLSPADDGASWRLVASDGASPSALVAADVALVPADSPLPPEQVDRLALPLAVLVSADRPVLDHWIDRADGFVLEGDAPATQAALFARLAHPDTPDGVADDGGAVQQIAALSSEARRLAEALARLVQEADAGAEAQVSAGLVRRLIRLRRDRDRHMPAELFADPAWDILLDLAAARMEGTNVPVSSLCVAAAVPTTTALRWIRTLSDAGMVLRSTDPLDARRSFLVLSDTAHHAMLAWLRRFAAVFQMR
jgi:hypothetical protein